MKKSLLAVAVAAALPTFAQAQSSVTLFGILDASVEYSNEDANRAINATTGAVGAADSGLRLNSGTQSGSRFGVRGVEDLGGGLKAIFTIEHRLSVDTGDTAGGGFNNANGNFWNGQAWVGLETRFGNITAGRQYSPIFWALIPADFTAYGFYNNWAGFTGAGFSPITPQGPIRLNNSVSYKSPTMGGLTVYGTYAMGENLTGTGSSNDIMGIAAGWQLGGLYLGAGYHSIDAAAGLETVLAATASYKFTSLGLSLGYTQQEFVGGGEVATILASAFANFGPGTLFLNVAMVSPDVAGLKNDDSMQLGVAYSMPLSKRTNWYVAVGTNDLTGLQPAASTVSVDGAMRASIGLRHLF
ncbi:MAG: porin [Burkholderiales bacterium]|nr:MAG: porin [Burkholderiales bacterium]